MSSCTPSPPRSGRASPPEAESSGISTSLLRMVRSRLPRLSKNETEKELELHYAHRRHSSTFSSSTMVTPPPEYRSRTSLLLPDDNDKSSSADESSDDAVLDHTGRFPPSPYADVWPEQAETESGVQWKYAHQGTNLLDLSTTEAKSASFSNSKRGIPTLTRQLYIHGVSYSLRGLPTDLSKEEIVSILAALPSDVQEAAFVASKKYASERDKTKYPSLDPDPSCPPSLIHRVIAFLILQFFLFIQMIAPYLRIGLAKLAAYERQHHVSERLLASGIRGVDGVIKAGDRVCAMRDGQVGEMIEAMLMWWIRGIAGGIKDGVGEGLVRLRDEKEQEKVSESIGRR